MSVLNWIKEKTHMKKDQKIDITPDPVECVDAHESRSPSTKTEQQEANQRRWYHTMMMRRGDPFVRKNYRLHLRPKVNKPNMAKRPVTP